MPRAIAEDILDGGSKFHELFSGEVSKEKLSREAKPYYKAMATDIMNQKKRLGGSFAVAHAIATRTSREDLRGWMGPDLVFVVLNMTKECQIERIEERHGGAVGDVLEKLHALYEPAEEDEPNPLISPCKCTGTQG